MHWGTATIRVPDKPLLSLDEVKVCVGYSVRTIRRWVAEGKFPRPKKIAGGGRKWSNMAVAAWLLWQEYAPDPASGEVLDDLDDDDDDEPEEKPRARGVQK